MDHVLFVGPPASANTRWRRSSRASLGVGFRATRAVIAKDGDIAALCEQSRRRDVLFIDEIIASMPRGRGSAVPAMEDFELDLILGEGGGSLGPRENSQITLGGEKNARGCLDQSVRDRFGISGA